MDELSDLRHLNLPFDIDKVTPQCHKCIRKQLVKYKKFIAGDDKPVGERFLVPCKGILKEPLDLSMKPLFSDDMWEEAQTVNDVVLWAEKYLRTSSGEPWVARWPQAEILRCTSKRKMLRCSRRVGKTDSISVEITHKLFTNDKLRILVAGPLKNHTEEIFTRIRAFIEGNPLLAQSITKNVSSPYYEVKLNNGSRVRGFAAGAKGGSEGLAMRSQDADLIYLEEMAFIDEKSIIGAVMPILQTTPNTGLCGFSTPTSFRSSYYTFCEENPYYVEFFYDYKVLPHYKNVEMERSNFTEQQWTNEFLAQWGFSDEGVYKPEHIDKALTIYDYSSCTPNPRWKYTIGTDWNEQHGTEIMVLGHDPYNKIFQVVEAVCVEKTQFTQLKGVEKVLELNRKWHPEFVYVDSGGGATNYELLMKTSYDHRTKGGDPDTARLMSILRKYDSGSSLKIKDPITNEDRKFPAKPFMVNASIRMFEQGRIQICAEDTTLEKQLRSYIIERTTPTKVPVYGLKEPKVKDHRLDALNLAIVAFHIEYDDLYKKDISINIAVMPDPRRINKQSENVGNPADRRVDADIEDLTWQEAALVKTIGISARSNRSLAERIPTNRLGWDTDEEEKHRQQWLQRRRSRSKVNRAKPRRTNI